MAEAPTDILSGAREWLASCCGNTEAPSVACREPGDLCHACEVVTRLIASDGALRAQLATAERERGEREEALQRIGTLEKALGDLIIDANRLCDRELGGIYEDDCRLSLAKARHALAPSFHTAPTPAPPAPVTPSEESCQDQ